MFAGLILYYGEHINTHCHENIKQWTFFLRACICNLDSAFSHVTCYIKRPQWRNHFHNLSWTKCAETEKKKKHWSDIKVKIRWIDNFINLQLDSTLFNSDFLESLEVIISILRIYTNVGTYRRSFFRSSSASKSKQAICEDFPCFV